MSNKDYRIPYQDLINLVPKNLRNPVLKSLIDNLFNRFLTRDEAVPLYGYVGRKPAAPEDQTPKVPQITPERDINALVPVLSFRTGTEVNSFTPQDIINKATVLGAPANQAEWLYSQGNNYAPPINYDKFTNFFNYYWIASAVPTPPQLDWNPALAPEYYTIAQPALTDDDKLNARTAATSFTVLTGTGFYQQTWDVDFISDVDFTVTASGPLIGFAPGDTGIRGPFSLTPLPAAPYAGPYTADEFNVSYTAGVVPTELLSFTIKREAIFDDSGAFAGYESFQAGDKITISAPFISPNYNISFTGSAGIKGKVVAVSSLDTYQTINGVTLREGDRVLVTANLAAENGIYIVTPGEWVRAPDFDSSTAAAGARVFVREGALAGSLFTSFVDGVGFGWTLTATNTTSNTNIWQESNYWVPRSQLTVLDVDLSKVVQATRPIIEYDATLQLNSYFNNGAPSNLGTPYIQSKTSFNQVPLFDLFRYDGTHAGMVSPLFFYVEDLVSEIDPVLQRRVKRAANQSGDFLFAHGAEIDGTTLFFKSNGALRSIWKAGYTGAQVTGQSFSGNGNGVLTVDVSTSDPFTPQQIWTLTATSPTTFSVTGSKNQELPPGLDVIQVGVPYDNGLFTATITAGSTAFDIGDRFIFAVGNLETTRYVYRDENELLLDLFGGPAADVAGEGAWQVPRMFFSNLKAEANGEITEGTLYSHLRSIINNQLPGQPVDSAFGGTIKLWSEQVNLLSALLMQRDLTPVSLVDLAQRQYESSTNAIVSLYLKHARQYLVSNGAVTNLSELDALVDYLLDLRVQDHDVKTVLFDSSSPVRGFPATLPLLGAVPLAQPGYYFDNELGVTLIRRHDGSLLPPFSNTISFRDQFGPPGTSLPQDMAALLNDVLLTIELRLFNGISPVQRSYFSAGDITSALSSDLAPYLRQELASWAAINGYDATAADYVATDAFTWNYSAANLVHFPTDFNGTSVPARWFNVLKAHHEAVPGVIPTSRPDLEPWKLLGFPSDPGAAWDIYRAAVTPEDVAQPGFYVGPTARVVLQSDTPLNTTLSGVGVFDGVAVQPGDRVLLVSEGVQANNGVWIVSTGAWTRDPITLQAGLIINVTAGALRSGTSYALTATVPTPGVDPVLFTEVRRWTSAMWSYIKTQRPQLRLSVNTVTDELLAPYVSPSSLFSVEALTTVLPPNPQHPYEFGESSAVETAWVRSTEYLYSLVRAVCKKDPLAWIGHMWGFEWVEVDGILYDSRDVAVPSVEKFKLHGEAQAAVARTSPLSLGFITGPGPINLIITRDAYTATRDHAWSVRTADGQFLGTVNEGTFYPSITSSGYVLTSLLIEDNGVPFRIGDRFTITANADGSGRSISFEQASTVIFNGFGQTFAHALREGNIDTSQGYSIKAYREWDVNLGYRAGGLVSTDDLRVFNDAETIPASAYELRLKRSGYAGDFWVQALRITVVQRGQSTPVPGGYAMVGAGDDWVFRVQSYNNRYPVITIKTLDTAGEFVTFQALSGQSTSREWRKYTGVTGELQLQLPVTITGLQNLLNILFGYEAKLLEDGWVFEDPEASNVDAETGRIRSWQLDVEKLIDRVYRGINEGQGHVLNPFIDRVWFSQQTGLLSKFYDTTLFDVSGHPAVFDTLGEKLKTDDIVVMRGKELSQISAAVPMFSVHAQVDEFEHLFVFANYSSPSTNSGLIFDAFSGARIATVKFNGRRQGNGTLRPEFGGHYLVGSEVRKNIQASADNISKYYDTDAVYQDQKTTQHALALLGFTPKQYMRDLDLTDRSQFNFWRGLVQMKGTNASLAAFLNNGRFLDARLDEYWAYKVAEYGDARPKVYPELKLSVQDTLQQFTKLQFDVSADPLIPGQQYDPTFTQVFSDDETRWFSIEDLSQDPTRFEAIVVGSYSRAVVTGEVIQLPFIADYLDLTGSTCTVDQVNDTTLLVTGDGDLSVVGFGASTPNFNPVKLINYADGEVVENIPLWHPAFGQHTPAALENINIISSRDPARYNFSTLVAGNSNFDPARAWGAREVGRVWWDTTNLSYVPYYDSVIYPELDQRLNRWGALADFATVDVVEWVESAVPPDQYDAQAVIDAGDADLDPFTKADGQVYGAKTYERSRQWHIRPIAWSSSATAVESAHTGGAIGQRGQFNADYDARLYFQADRLVLSTGTFDSAGITAGMHIGAVDDTRANFRALSESVIQELITHVSTSAADAPFTGAAGVTVGSLVGDISLRSTRYIPTTGELVVTSFFTDEQLFDSDGNLLDEWEVRSFVRIRVLGTEFDETVQIRADLGLIEAQPNRGAQFDVQELDRFTFTFESLGLEVSVTVQQDATAVPTEALASLISSALSSAALSVFAAATYRDIVPLAFPVGGYSDDLGFLSNDFSDPDQLDHRADSGDPGAGGLGWRAWSVPSQAQLNADARYPNSRWYPVVGPLFEITPSIDAIQEAAGGAAELLLNNGTVVRRYETNWADWIELRQQVIKQAALVTGDVQVQVPLGTPVSRVSVYVNGVAQLAGTYELIGTTLTVFDVTRGHQVVTVIRPYAPTVAELEFDPAVEENLLIQKQFKVDYQYVEVPVRNGDGNITSTRYYFWVKNRSTAARNKSRSVKSMRQDLENGPGQYLTFQYLEEPAGPGDVPKYNSITISGLSYVVAKDDAFKLRFTRDFTLRDNPDGLNLKDTHTEWSLIRPGQKTKIPEQLWNKLVDAACGQDAVGNTLPSPQRQSYDERNGTRTQFGFAADQIIAPTELVRETLLYTILNTKLIDETGPVPVPDYMDFLDFNESDSWFITPESTRIVLTRIWNEASPVQINELFFAVLEDVAASNYEMTDIFKTSRLSAYSIKIVRASPVIPTYE